jgi:hypothetical protein
VYFRKIGDIEENSIALNFSARLAGASPKKEKKKKVKY